MFFSYCQQISGLPLNPLTAIEWWGGGGGGGIPPSTNNTLAICIVLGSTTEKVKPHLNEGMHTSSTW